MTFTSPHGAAAPAFSPVSLADEPSIEDILGDPITALILRRDGITAAAVRAQLQRERERLAGLYPPQDVYGRAA
ncbi:hypothetical protein [Ancylobacter terrae]|uniref:hypothetical protein n=1 Tax=Ancylobacter sp. sgz301288 TaxID=3342077 RepID=UPI00385E467A